MVELFPCDLQTQWPGTTGSQYGGSPGLVLLLGRALSPVCDPLEVEMLLVLEKLSER